MLGAAYQVSQNYVLNFGLIVHEKTSYTIIIRVLRFISSSLQQKYEFVVQYMASKTRQKNIREM